MPTILYIGGSPTNRRLEIRARRDSGGAIG